MAKEIAANKLSITDSLAGITSKTVREWQMSLEEIERHTTVTFTWVLANAGATIEKADCTESKGHCQIKAEKGTNLPGKQ